MLVMNLVFQCIYFILFITNTRFHPEQWAFYNHFSIIDWEENKTNNFCEGYHNGLKLEFSISASILDVVLKLLLVESFG